MLLNVSHVLTHLALIQHYEFSIIICTGISNLLQFIEAEVALELGQFGLGTTVFTTREFL